MSETPSKYTAKEAEAEGVRPLSEEELAEMQRWVSGLTFVQGGLADRIERLLATLDAARAELQTERQDHARQVRQYQEVLQEARDDHEQCEDFRNREIQERRGVEAEAAVLREALQSYAGLDNVSFGGIKLDVANRTVTEDSPHYDAGPAVRALNTTQAGADLLERVRQLEGVARFAAVAVEEARNIGIWSQGLAELEEALEALDQHHQGTGAAGEGE